jgi:hypothetical protein
MIEPPIDASLLLPCLLDLLDFWVAITRLVWDNVVLLPEYTCCPTLPFQADLFANVFE